MRSESIKVKAFALLLAALMLVCTMPAAVFAEGMTVSLQKTGAASLRQGDSIYFEVTAQASNNTPYRLMVVPADNDLQVVSGNNAQF